MTDAVGEVAVRRASLSDLDAAGALFDAYRQFYGNDSDPAAASAYLRARLGAGESVVLLAETGAGTADAVAVGFAQLYPTFCSLDLAPIMVLYDLYVAEAARRLGVGRMLLGHAAAVGRASGASRLELSTAPDNVTAQSLYESEGWVPDSTYRHYELPLL